LKGLLSISAVILAIALPAMETSAANTTSAAALIGIWVQDDTGPALTYRRRYHFKPDGSYEFVFTSRNTGSLEQKVLAKEGGTFTAEARRLTLAPKAGSAKSLPWRIEKDPYVGSIRLVMVLPDGKLDIYYRE
jgi:hypothetical protein